MFVSYIILTLAKISEFYDKYHDVIPEECRRPCKDLKTKIEKLGIRDFRNVFVGHIHDKSDRPISDDQIEDHYQKITNGDVIKFLEWINTPDTNTLSTTVVGIVESARDKILQQYGVSL